MYAMRELPAGGHGHGTDASLSAPDHQDMSERSSAEQLRRSRALLALQYAVSGILATSSALDDAMPRLLEALCTHLNWDAGAYWMVDRRSHVLRCRTFWHRPALDLDRFQESSQEAAFAPGMGLPGRVWASGTPLLISDLTMDPRVEGATAAAVARLQGAVGFPIPAADDLHGVVECFSHDVGGFDPDLAQALTALGTQIGQFVERTQMEAALRASEERLHTVVANAPVVLFAVDQNGIFTLSEGQGLAALGIRPGEHVGQSYFALYGHLSDSVASMRRALAGENAITIERFKGLVFETRWMPTRNSDGTVIGVIGVSSDITERAWIEEERRRLERRTREMLDALLAMAQAMMQLPDEAGDGHASAQAVTHRLGVLMRDLLECHSVGIIVVTPDDRLRPLDCIGLSAAQNEEWRERLVNWPRRSILFDSLIHRLRQGEMVLVDTSRPEHREMTNPFGIDSYLIVPMRVGTTLIGLLAVAYGPKRDAATRDDVALLEAIATLGALVLERERLQQEREEARGRALALQEAKRRMDEFLGIAGHEMRTPLTSIKGNLQLAQRRLLRLIGQEMAEQIQGGLAPLLNRTEAQVLRLERLVGDILDVSRIQAGRLGLHRQRCDLSAIVRGIVDEQRDVASERPILLEGAGDPIAVYADAERIGQVVTNYLTNALKYAPADRPITVGVQLDGTTARVWVRDQGPGLASAEQERVWELFYRAPDVARHHGSSVGLGMGLHISRTIVEQHGGRVGVESVPGAGANFWFTLPITP